MQPPKAILQTSSDTKQQLLQMQICPLDSPHFHAEIGGKLDGKLHIFSPFKLKNVQIKISLRGVAEIVMDVDDTIVPFARRFLNESQDLTCAKATISPSQYSPLQIPFSFAIPESLSQTFYDPQIGSILYSLKATLTFKNGFKTSSVDARQDVIILHCPSPHPPLRRFPQNDLSLPCDLEIGLSSDCIVIGESINCKVRMHGESLQSHREIEYIRATLECHIKRKGTSTSLPQASESTIFVARDSAHHQHHRQFGGWSGSFNLSPNPNLVKPSVKTRILSIETYITIEIALKSRSEGIFVQIPITVARNLPLDRPPLKSSHFLSPPLTVNTSQKAPPLLVTSSAHHGYDLISPLDETLSEIDEVVNLYTPPVSAGILKLDCLMNEIISDLSDSHLSSVTLSSDKLYSQNLSSEGESSAAEDSFIDTAYYSPSYN